MPPFRAGLCAALLSLPAPLAAASPPASFAAENAEAMSRMHAAMTIAPSGDVDRDFVAMMIPHHQGGIDMAMAVLRHGKNEQVRRLAQEIIVEQQAEIAALRRAIAAPQATSGSPSPDRAHAVARTHNAQEH